MAEALETTSVASEEIGSPDPYRVMDPEERALDRGRGSSSGAGGGADATIHTYIHTYIHAYI